MRRLAKKEGLMSSVEEDGVIAVEGEAIGKIAGLSFVADPAVAGSETRLLKTAAVQALAAEVAARAKSLSATSDTELKLSRLGFIEWHGHPVGRLVAADARFRPRAEVIADDVLAPADRELVRERLQKFAERHIASLIEPLMKLEESEGFDGLTRGIAYRLAESYGVLPREGVAEEVKQLGQDDRAKLRALGVRFGAFTLFLPALLKPAATDVRLLLWWLEQQKQGTVTGEVPAAPANGLTSATADTSKPEGFYRMCGYRICGPRAVRVDMLERLSDLIRDRVFWKPRIPEEVRPQGAVEGGGFTVVPDMMSLVGCSGEEFEAILNSLGFRAQKKMLPRVATPGAKGRRRLHLPSKLRRPKPRLLRRRRQPRSLQRLPLLKRPPKPHPLTQLPQTPRPPRPLRRPPLNRTWSRPMSGGRRAWGPSASRGTVPNIAATARPARAANAGVESARVAKPREKARAGRRASVTTARDVTMAVIRAVTKSAATADHGARVESRGRTATSPAVTTGPATRHPAATARRTRTRPLPCWAPSRPNSRRKRPEPAHRQVVGLCPLRETPRGRPGPCGWRQPAREPGAGDERQPCGQTRRPSHHRARGPGAGGQGAGGGRTARAPGSCPPPLRGDRRGNA